MTIQQSFGFSTNRWCARWQAFPHPFNGEKERLLRARWESWLQQSTPAQRSSPPTAPSRKTVLVVASGTIGNNSRLAIDSIIGEQFSRHVQYLEGAEVRSLLEKYFPELTALDSLKQAHATLNAAVPDFIMATAV